MAKVPLDLPDELCEKIDFFSKKGGQGRSVGLNGPAPRFPSPYQKASLVRHPPIAMLPAFERWRWFGVPEVSEWKSYNKMTCGVCSTYVGGAETAAWESRLEMERFGLTAGQEEQRGV